MVYRETAGENGEVGVEGNWTQLGLQFPVGAQITAPLDPPNGQPVKATRVTRDALTSDACVTVQCRSERTGLRWCFLVRPGRVDALVRRQRAAGAICEVVK